MKRGWTGILCLLASLPLMSGCGSFRETFPARSGIEQMLISTAMDRAVEKMPTAWMDGASVFVDDANLDAYDSPYLRQLLRQSVLANGGTLADSRDDASMVLEVASGGVSVDKGNWMFGLPKIPLPIPFAGETLVIPEAPLFRLDSYVGKAKLLFTPVDAATKAQVREIPVCYGRSRHRFWWILLFGPFTTSDLPPEAR